MFGRMHQQYGDGAATGPADGPRRGLGRFVVLGVLAAIAVKALSHHGAGPRGRAWHA